LQVEQEARECLLTPGSMMLLDPRLPYKGAFSGGSELLVWKLPRRELEARLGLTRDLVGSRLMPAEGRSTFLAAYVSPVRDHTKDVPLGGAGQIECQLLDLTASAFSNGLRRKRISGRSKTLVRLHLRAAIEAHLADPKIDAATVAGAVGISVRYANFALADEQTSLRRLILDQRLERCGSRLAIPHKRTDR
jgi:hypothetical protein